MFTVVDGNVGSKNIIGDNAGQLLVSAPSGTLELNFMKAFRLTRIMARCDDGAIQFTLKLYSSPTKEWGTEICEISSEGQQEVNNNVCLEGISADSKIYCEFSHQETSEKLFKIRIIGESLKSISI